MKRFTEPLASMFCELSDQLSGSSAVVQMLFLQLFSWVVHPPIYSSVFQPMLSVVQVRKIVQPGCYWSVFWLILGSVSQVHHQRCSVVSKLYRLFSVLWSLLYCYTRGSAVWSNLRVCKTHVKFVS